MKSLVRPAVTLFVLLTLVTGLAYPWAVTGIARLAFPSQAAGSLIVEGGRVVGSSLVGQNFSDPRHFWGRPSATSPMPYNAANSGGSNQGPSNPALADAVQARIEALRAADPGNAADIPIDLVTASASGIDPEISIAGARYQVARVARARRVAPETIEAIVSRHARGRLFGLLGEPRVNVLELNLDLDRSGRR